jgi:hypothetical protein
LHERDTFVREFTKVSRNVDGGEIVIALTDESGAGVRSAHEREAA